VVAIFLLLSPFLNRQLTSYVESSSFGAILDREASKGLKLDCKFSPIHRSGLLSVAVEDMDGSAGDHTMKSLQAKQITAKFNPLGIFLKRWQLNSIEANYGLTELQKTEYKPSPPPSPRPWYLFLFPDRFYLSHIFIHSADVVWKFRKEPAGIYGLKVTVTPNDRDFEYDASDGTLRMSSVPELKVIHLHTLIRKPRLYLYNADLTTDSEKGRMSIQGEAGLQEDRSISAHVDIDELPLRNWLPENWRNSFEGQASGSIDWQSVGTKVETANVDGELRIAKGRLHHQSSLDQIAKLTNKENLKDLKLTRTKIQFVYSHQDFTIRQLGIESEGIFSLEGHISVKKKELRGTCDFGVNEAYLEWLPDADKIFSEKHDGYLWTKIHLSGTIDEPKEDLSSRIKELIFESPITLFGFLFQQIGQWFDNLLD
jgi:hypothetical protein